MSPDAPTAWTLYIGTDDLDALAQRVTANGGTVAMPPFDVGDQGRMAVFQDPTERSSRRGRARGWGGFQTTGPNAFGWADLSTRGVDKAVPFYENVFGWSPKRSGASSRTPSSRCRRAVDRRCGEMAPNIPAEMPSHWMVYFTVDDVDAAHRRVQDAGREMVAPLDFPVAGCRSSATRRARRSG